MTYPERSAYLRTGKTERIASTAFFLLGVALLVLSLGGACAGRVREKAKIAECRPTQESIEARDTFGVKQHYYGYQCQGGHVWSEYVPEIEK